MGRRARFCGALLVAIWLLVAMWAAGPAAGDGSCPAPISGLGSGTVYYVSPAGSDTNAGTSPCGPWQSLAKVDSFGLRPGDTVAFQGGQAFTAPLSPWGGLQGTAAEPIYYTSYGTGRADLTGGVYLSSVSYLTLDGLEITSSAGPGVGTGGRGSGATNIVVRNSSVSSTYSGGIGGYGVALRNPVDSHWTIAGDDISDTADSGIFSIGSSITVEHDTLSSDGIGASCGTGGGQNPCHAVYAKGPGAIVLDNTISSPQSVGISLRAQGDIAQGNSIAGGQKGIAFSSETSTPGTTYIVGNTVSGQSDTGIQVYSGTQPLYESFVIASNTVYDPAGYGIYVMSGPSSATTQTVTLANNLVQAGPPTRGYLNLAYPTSYTRGTYTEQFDLFYGAAGSTPYYVNGSARTWSAYANWFGTGSEGRNDLTRSDPQLNSTTFALGGGSPAIGAGTASVPGIAYVHVAACPISVSAVLLRWQYCGSSGAPDMGSH